MGIYIYIWVNYNDLTATSLEIMVSKGNYPQLALIQVNEYYNLLYIYILLGCLEHEFYFPIYWE